MQIKRIDVKHFRSLKDTSLNCDSLTAIVGRNGAGKSSFLFAVKYFYDLTSSITMEDYYNRDTNEPIEIRITFHMLTDNEKEEFSKYLQDDEFSVTKKISVENGKPVAEYYGLIMQIPEFAEIRAVGNKNKRKADWKELCKLEEFKGLESVISTADAIDPLMEKFEYDNPQKLVSMESKVQFLGPRNVGGGKLDKYTKFVLIPAVRDVSDEMGAKQGAIHDILEMIVNRRINAREDVIKLRADFDERIKKVFNVDNLTELAELGTAISKTLKGFAPGSELSLNWNEITTPDVKLPPPIATLTEDGFEGDITRKGHGLQRALVLTLLQHLAVSVPYVGETENETNGEVELILAVEEPELYLHPARSRLMAKVLAKLTTGSEYGLGSRNQVIYTTHSPYFVGLDRFDSLRIVHKTSCDNDNVSQCTVSSFSFEQLKNELARISDKNPDEYSQQSAKIRSIPIMNSDVNEGFFADVVVIVEGNTEVGMLWQIQEELELNWLELGITIVPVDGKNNIDRPTVIFRGLDIPTFFIFDADSKHKGGKDENKTANSNDRLLRLANKDTVGFPPTLVEEHFAVFENDIETEFKQALKGTGYEMLLDAIGNDLEIPQGKLSKNMEGATQMVKRLYQRGDKFELLEEIALRITSLRN